MNKQLIRDRLHSNTKPFILRLSDGTLSDGTRVGVAHPGFVAVAPGQVVVIGEKGGITRFDALHVVAMEEGRPKRPKANSKRAR